MRIRYFFNGIFSVLILTFFLFSLVLVYNNSVSLIDETQTIRVKETESGYEVLGVNLSEEEIIENYSPFLPHSFKALSLIREEAKETLGELLEKFQ